MFLLLNIKYIIGLKLYQFFFKMSRSATGSQLGVEWKINRKTVL